MFVLGRDLTYHIYEQEPGVYPSSGQIDNYLALPLVVAFLLAACAWLVNGLQRWFAALGVVAALSLVLLLTYLLSYGGGV